MNSNSSEVDKDQDSAAAKDDNANCKVVITPLSASHAVNTVNVSNHNAITNNPSVDSAFASIGYDSHHASFDMQNAPNPIPHASILPILTQSNQIDSPYPTQRPTSTNTETQPHSPIHPHDTTTTPKQPTLSLPEPTTRTDGNNNHNHNLHNHDHPQIPHAPPLPTSLCNISNLIPFSSPPQAPNIQTLYHMLLSQQQQFQQLNHSLLTVTNYIHHQQHVQTLVSESVPIPLLTPPSANTMQCIRELVTLCKSMSNPKPFNLPKTSRIHQLKQIMKEKYPNSIKVDVDDKKYEGNIKAYLRRNPDSPRNPELVFSANTSSSSSSSSKRKKAKTVKQSEVVKKVKITDYERVPSLNGEYGLEAHVEIPRNTVIGEYYGEELLSHEANLKYRCFGFDAIKMNEYAFDREITDNFTREQIEKIMGFEFDDEHETAMEGIEANSNSKLTQNVKESKKRKLEETASEAEISGNLRVQKRKKRKLAHGRSHGGHHEGDDEEEDEKEELYEHTFIVTIDGYNAKPQSMMIWLNDCKKNIMNMLPTNDDLEYVNVELVTVKHNGWPKILAVSKQAIKVGEMLFTAYCMSYPQIQRDKELLERRAKEIERKMNDIIVRNGVTL